MWLQPPTPMTNRWVLHVAATNGQVADVLHDACIHERPHYNGDRQFPVYLCGTASPYEPPVWMSVARAELHRRGHLTRWCDANCPHHPWPPRSHPTQPGTPCTDTACERGRSFTSRTGPRTQARLLTGGVPHHRTRPARPDATASTGQALRPDTDRGRPVAGGG
jgi:hypothetical protein